MGNASKVASLEKITIATRDENNDHINELGLNMITLLTGYNGSGKSMFLVTSYVLSEIALLVAKKFPESILKETAQFITDSCYSNRLTGRIEGFFDTGAYMAVHMDDGKVTGITTENWETTEEVRNVRYMSAAMRTFEAIGNYLFTRKILKHQGDEQMLMQLCKNFKLYDVKHVEGMIAKMPLKIEQHTLDALKNFDIKDEIETFDVDLEKCDFFYKEKGTGKTTYMKTLGNGHQSIFNMIIGQL